MEDRIIRRLVRPTGLALGLATLLAAAPVAVQGPGVTVEPTGLLPAGSTTITVTGSGFDPNVANGNGIYVVFGPITAAPGYYLDPSIYGAFKWVSPGGAESPATAPLGADGTFSTTLDITSTMTTSAGDIDCTTAACAVITFAAHGSQDRSQDTCTWVRFVSDGSGPAAPAASPVDGAEASLAPAASVAPASSAAPDASTVPAPADPCAAINATAP